MSSHGNQELVERFLRFYRDYYRDEISDLAQKYPDERRSLIIDYDDLYTHDPDLAEDFRTVPGTMGEYAEEALRQYDLSADIKLGGANVRLQNLPDTTDLEDIRSHHLSELIQVLGRVESSSRIESALTEAAFECQRCGTMTYIPQSSQSEQEPHECQGCERKGPFRLNQDHSEYVDRQTIRVEQRVQGLGDDTDVESIVVMLEDDLVDAVSLGDPVRVVGMVRKVNDSSDYFDATIFDKYLDAISIEEAENDFHLEITEEDQARFLELSEDPDIYEKIVDSIAPSVFGYSDAKLAVALQLFGGVSKTLPDGTSVRGDIHTLLVGDPGTARTKLLRYASRLAPRAVYANGSQTTGVGLTAAATPSSGNSDPWELKSGVMVMASGGLACLDDFDAFREEERRPLHEALETQELSISKASVTETLSTETSVLAAANPKYGRFDQYEPLGEQIDLEPGLISRFDLLFTVTDEADPSRDAEMADHILDANLAGEAAAGSESSTVLDQSMISELAEDFQPPIEPVLLRKYIAYSRRSCFPEMSEEAKDLIKEFYVDLRSRGVEEDAPLPVSTRKLESIVRLAEASARVRLSDSVGRGDAERVIELVKNSLYDIGLNGETGQFDADVIETGEPVDADDLKEVIEAVEARNERGAPVEKVVERAERQLGLNEETVEEGVEDLKKKGEVYEPALDHLRTT